MRTFILILIILASGVIPASGSMHSKIDKGQYLSASIIGRWSAKDINSNFTLESATDYNPDGSTEMVAHITTQNEHITITVKGTWKISNRKLIVKATESSHPQILPVGVVTEDEIVSISSDKMILISEDGERLVRDRVIPTQNKSNP